MNIFKLLCVIDVKEHIKEVSTNQTEEAEKLEDFRDAESMKTLITNQGGNKTSNKNVRAQRKLRLVLIEFW
jgi:hypothetical protein